MHESTAKMPAVKTAVISSVYDLIDDGTIRAPHTLQLRVGGGGQGGNMHAEEAAINEAEAARVRR